MGLFGYGKGDFEKNTGVFKQRVNNLLFDLHRLGNQEYGIGSVLNAIIKTLDNVKYTKHNGKAQDAIDERISKLIDSLEKDLQKKNAGSFSEHMRMLGEAVDDCRRYGEEAYTADELQAQESMATVKGYICDALNNKGEVDKSKQELLKKAKKLLTEGKKAEAQKLELEFNACVAKEEQLNERITAFSTQYNALLKVSKIKERGQLAVEMDAVKLIQGSEADFAREIQKANVALERQMERTGNIINMVDEADKDINDTLKTANTGSSSFMTLIETDMATGLKKSVDTATVEDSSESTSEFEQMLKNL